MRTWLLPVSVGAADLPSPLFQDHAVLRSAQKECRFADATVQGDRVVLDATADDAFVRYGWAGSPICNLFNNAELPAVPFEVAVAR